ncbi:MAG: DUF3343 domain-containing protein [Sporomusaceae bacterium]|jgi:hypothetical protein|nr:DUF3343 domain-containing protein [Sporomusaceae bacterium]
MNKYIATFYSHFGALSYCKALKNQGIQVKLMPVPRKVSSSCGTCAVYEHGEAVEIEGCELEAIYLETSNAMERLLTK